jgi:hypothetical protein
MLMFGSFLSWWYGEGWAAQVREVGDRLSRVNDRYSIGLLLSTLFSPFRQISAGSVRGPLGVQMRAFFDRLISRFIGAGIRSVLIGIGLTAAFIGLLLGVLRIIFWPLLPVLPLIGLVLSGIGGML